MRHFQLFYISIISLFITCSDARKTVASIQGKNIHLSDIYKVFDETIFNELEPNKKTAFVRKYTVYKQLSSSLEEELKEIDFFIAKEEKRIRNDLIVQQVEKHLVDNLEVSDSTLEFIGDAINTDILVKALTVTHQFSFGKGNERTKKEAFKKAEMIFRRIESGELTFAEAMSIYGELDVSKIKGNDMGQIYFGLMPKSFNDIVWTSPMGKLHGPLESPIGYHVVIVENTVQKIEQAKREFDADAIIKDLKRGRYGYQAAHFQNFIEDLYNEYEVSFDIDELYNAWKAVQTIDGIHTMSGIAVDQLKKANFSPPVGRAGMAKITLDWIVKETENYTFYKTAAVKNGYSFEKVVKDATARHLMVKWYEDNKKLFPGYDKTIMRNTVKKIYGLYFDKMQALHPNLTKDIILNRFMLDNDIIINSTLFAEDV